MRQKISILTRPLSRTEVRAVDQEAIERFGMSGLVLMENAGRNAAEMIDTLAPPGDICILCGKGNNGGDGYVIGRHLEAMGRTVRIVSLVDPAELSGDAAVNHRIAALADIPIATPGDLRQIGDGQMIGECQTIVDCMLGTGASGAPREPLASAIRYANESTGLRIAIDLPSGLDCDTGIPSEPTFRADHTLTFVASKIGFASPPAAAYLGQVVVLPIGIPAKQLRELAS